jgi:hypothetical protein
MFEISKRDGRFLDGRRRKLAVLSIATILTIAILSLTHVSPLATHALRAPPNSQVIIARPNLKGIASLPVILSSDMERERWEILGGSLLQLGFSRLSVPALTRAVALDPHNLGLRSALGEALVLADRGHVTVRAKAEFDIVLAEDPNDLIARFYLAYWLLQNGSAKPALVKWVGLMRAVGNDSLWNGKIWAADAMPRAANEVGVAPLALRALCVAGM